MHLEIKEETLHIRFVWSRQELIQVAQILQSLIPKESVSGIDNMHLIMSKQIWEVTQEMEMKWDTGRMEYWLLVS